MNNSQDQLARRCVQSMLDKHQFSRWLGVELIECQPDRALVRMRVRPEMLNGFGVAHGGIAFSLADSAFAFAANTHGTISVSVRNDISYPIAVRAGDVLIASAKKVSEGNKIISYDVEVQREDKTVVALFRGTVYRTSRNLLQELGG